MILFARASTFGGIVRPICLVALRLMMNSNFVRLEPTPELLGFERKPLWVSDDFFAQINIEVGPIEVARRWLFYV